MKKIAVTGSFDDLRSHHIRLLEEASKLGELHLLLWSDEAVRAVTGQPPQFPQKERLYLTQAIRYVDRVDIVDPPLAADALPLFETLRPDLWVVDQESDSPQKRNFCATRNVDYCIVTDADLADFPEPPPPPSASTRKKVIVTGCYDWFHSGHVRFFEEVSELGDLYVAAGNDANVRHLKGEGHPMFPQEERRYVVHSIRYVTHGLITSGMGWMDAEPDIARLKPDIYAVNEDGDKPEKQAFCKEHGLEYVVLKRTPKEGLTKRSSTHLRGF